MPPKRDKSNTASPDEAKFVLGMVQDPVGSSGVGLGGRDTNSRTDSTVCSLPE